jgi:arylsulfatase A-like enzyme
VEMDAACFAGIRDRHHKYVHFAALPPILFDLDADPAELLDRSGDPAKAPVLLDLAQKMLSWRLIYAERTLTGYRATPQGLQERR